MREDQRFKISEEWEEDAMGYFIHNFLVYGREGEACLKEGWGNCK